jgi:GTPase SAR1 family protein
LFTDGLKHIPGRAVTFLVLGLDGAGKTVVTKRLVGEPVDQTDASIPTVGLNTWKTSYRRCNATVYDIGGGPGIRAIWRLYFQEVNTKILPFSLKRVVIFC